MKMKVSCGGRTVEVEVGDLRARPVVVMVEGERFEVWPEGQADRQPRAAPPAEAVPAARVSPPAPAPSAPNGAAPADGTAAAEAGEVRAPMPGVIVAVAVRPGDSVAAGQELCVLEAMKMKNSLRAERAGTIAAVHVAPGQHVRHREVLITYSGD